MPFQFSQDFQTPQKIDFRTPAQKIESARTKLIISFLVLLLIALFLTLKWSDEAEINKLTNTDSSPLSSALGSAAANSAVLACALLACALGVSKMPKIAFGIAAAIGGASVLYSVRGFYLVSEVFSAITRPGIDPNRGSEFAAGFMSVVLPNAVGYLIIGAFLISFCLPAFKAARELEETQAGPVVPSGRYGSLLSGPGSQDRTNDQVAKD